MNRIRSGQDAVGPQRWPDPGRHPFTVRTQPRPALLGPHCYSSGSMTVAERKILAGCPVEHECCWPTIWLSSLPNIVSWGGGGVGDGAGYSQLGEERGATVVWFSVILCEQISGSVVQQEDKSSPPKLEKHPGCSQRKAEWMRNTLSVMSHVFIWGHISYWVGVFWGVENRNGAQQQ